MPHFVYGIRFKTIVLMLTITLVLTVMITSWLYRKTTHILTEEMKYNQLTGIESTIKFVDVIMDDMDLISSNILSDRDLQQMVATPVEELTRYENYQNSTGIRDKLGNLKNVNEKIDSIYLYDWINNRIFSTDFNGYVKKSQMDALGWTTVKQLSSGTRQWNIIKSTQSSGNVTLISSKKQMSSKGRILFTFFINIDQKQFNTLLKGLKGSPHSLYYIVDEDLQLIASSEKVEPEVFSKVNDSLGGKKEDFELKIGKETYYIVKRNIREIGWTFVSLIPTYEIYGKLSQIRHTIVLICIASLAIIIFFGVYMNGLIYRPVKKLIEAMDRNKRGGPITCDVDRQKDEFGEIAANFNDLILQQYDLNQRLRQQEILTKNAEIRFLQSQINPHFLYNILDTIHWMARMGKNEDVAGMTFALSKFYRSSLNDGKELICVRDAIKQVEAYFDIQKIRFRNQIELAVDIEESLYDVPVPKRIFQPLMENAITHGIANTDRKGFLMISGVDLEDCVKLVIEDNGAGLAREELDRINREISEGDFDRPGNYALKNLNSQIKLLYGEEYGLSMDSSPGRGTTVTVRISKTTLLKEDDYHV